MVPVNEGVIIVIQVGKGSGLRNTSTATIYLYYPFVTHMSLAIC